MGEQPFKRAVDSQGNTLDCFFSPTRETQAAKRFFVKTPAASHISEPRVINVDKNAAYSKAFAITASNTN